MVRFASLTSTLQNFVPLGLGGFLSRSVFGCGSAAPSPPCLPWFNRLGQGPLRFPRFYTPNLSLRSPGRRSACRTEESRRDSRSKPRVSEAPPWGRPRPLAAQTPKGFHNLDTHVFGRSLRCPDAHPGLEMCPCRVRVRRIWNPFRVRMKKRTRFPRVALR